MHRGNCDPNLWLAMALVCLFTAGTMSVSAQPVLFGVDVTTSSGGPSTLVTINTVTGMATTIGVIPGFPTVSGLAFASDGTLYGVSISAFGGTGDLITIDPATGGGIAVGPVGFSSLAGLAFASDGTLFAAVNPDAPTAGGPVLATIDPGTGAGQIIGPIGYCVESLAMSAGRSVSHWHTFFD